MNGAWGDYNNDGFLDLRVGDQTEEILWRNDGRGSFDAVEGGPAGTPQGGQVSWVDFDNDGDLDPVIASGASDFPCRLFRNDGAGTLTGVADSGLEKATFAAGLAWADYDNDGWLDLFVTKFGSGGKNRLHHNNRGRPHFYCALLP